jgi:hypothetical protein
MTHLTDAEQLAIANRVLDSATTALVNHWLRGTKSRAVEATTPPPAYQAALTSRGKSKGHRVVSGRGGRKLEPELVGRIQGLLGADMTACEIALLVGVSSRTVERYRTTYNPIRKAS